MSKHGRAVLLGVMVVVGTTMILLATPPRAYAIPPFARQYNTSCSTCHLDFPKLNDFGKAFKDAGFKFPQDDESMLKIPPVLLGAPAQAEIWPKAIWPGKLPGQPPIGLRMNNFFQITGKNRNNFQFVPGANGATVPLDPATLSSLLPPKTDFQTGLFSIFTAGNFGSDIAFWVDSDFNVAGDNTAGGLGDGYVRFVNLSRFLHLPKDSFSVRAGQFELDLPFSPARSWNLSGWDIYGQTNIGAEGSQFVSNAFTMDTAAQGVEISGGHHYGGYWYSFTVFNQNTSGNRPITDFVPTTTGEAFQSDSNFKNLYGRLMYRFNLERDPGSRHAIQAAGATGPREHTYLAVGTFYLYGRSVQRLVGTSPGGTCSSGGSGCVLLTAREPFYRTGVDLSFNYRNFNLFGQWMHGRDHNLFPVDDSGTAAFDMTAVRFVHGVPATFSGGFLQADYLLYPWMMLIMRYDAVNSHADFVNGQLTGTGAAFFGPVHVTRNRVTPGVQFLIRANIKASFEYQVRPEQQIIGGVNPVNGTTPVNIAPFRVNTAVAGLEFVY